MAGDLTSGNGEDAGTDLRSPIGTAGEISAELASDAALTVDQVLGDPLTPGAAHAPAGETPEPDAAGEPYDSRIHSGTKTARGRWRRKKGAAREPSRSRGVKSTVGDRATRSAGMDGAAPRTAGSVSGAPVGGQGRAADEEPDPREDARPDAPRADPVACAALARSTVAVLSGTLTMALGEHWRATPTEAHELVTAWEAYFQARGVSRALAPEWGLALVLAGYAAPRLAHPETKKRTAGLRERAAVAWARWRTRTRKAQDYAHPGARENGLRQDDAAAAAGRGVSPRAPLRPYVELDPPRV